MILTLSKKDFYGILATQTLDEIIHFIDSDFLFIANTIDIGWKYCEHFPCAG